MSTINIKRVKTSEIELKDRLVSIQRVAKVTKGGLSPFLRPKYFSESIPLKTPGFFPVWAIANKQEDQHSPGNCEQRGAIEDGSPW